MERISQEKRHFNFKQAWVQSKQAATWLKLNWKIIGGDYTRTGYVQYVPVNSANVPVISADVPCTYYVQVCSGEGYEDEDEDGDEDLM